MFGQEVLQTNLNGETKQEIQLNVPSDCYLVCTTSTKCIVNKKVILGN